MQAEPSWAAQQGRHEFDGQLPDVSAAGLARRAAQLHAARTTIAKATTSTPTEALEQQIILNAIDSDLFWREKAKSPFKNPAFYLDKIDPDLYLSRNYAPLEVRLQGFIMYLRALPKVATDLTANLAGPLPKTFVKLGIDDLGGLSDFFVKDAVAAFASVKDEGLQKQLKEASAQAAQAMKGVKVYLESQQKTANDDFALGPDLFKQMLVETELVNEPVAHIEAVGRADLERNTMALKDACNVYLPRATLTACIAKMTSDKPKGDVIAAARKELTQLEAFVRKNSVVGIPSADEAKVAEAPPYNRSNIAFIQIPGPYDHGIASTYNIAPPDPKWTKTEQAAYIPSRALLTITSAHEVWPGHFLQYLHANANPSKVEALWVGYAFSEGWAHYTEELMIEEGLGKGDPAIHIAQLTEALLRDVRLLSAIGLHTHGMTVAESDAMFREKAFQDPGNARQQAARGTYDPAYLNYTLGKVMIRKLRFDWLTKSGFLPNDPTHWSAFHEKFLSYGGPPIPLLRREMLGEEGTVL